ncbi:S8 family peptidase [Motilibacter aurantiacus]|uniref:S8 family peptidase n=1 Tax=Motilibacter aurantiacus TaxID=2714955 RepID=UPI00140C5003|nr:S8/S53 family peptidase [Motilibacter aurantiacus]NHC46194.1 S8/S53 family peptidase [Motilibacter aurantiacus]
MVDQALRLERILRTHDEFVVVGEASENAAVVRRDALVVPPAAAGQLASALRGRYAGGVEDLGHLGLARVRVRGFDRGDQISEFVREQQLPVRPVHLVLGAPFYSGGPADKPRPVPALAAPGPSRATATAGSTVAVLDTGISHGHPWFPAGSWEQVDGLDAWDELDVDNDYDLDAQAGHGTAVAGVVRSVAPDAHLLVGRVLDSAGVSDEVAVAEALSRLRAHAARSGRAVDVVNLSLSCYTHDNAAPPSIAREIAAFGPDTVVVAAAGNAASTRPAFPAALDDVLGVGALDGDRPAPFSNSGPWVDAWAPGTRVPTTFVTRRDDSELPRLDIDEKCLDGYVEWSGTSFAAPHVAAHIAVARQAGRSPAQARAEALARFGEPQP